MNFMTIYIVGFLLGIVTASEFIVFVMLEPIVHSLFSAFMASLAISAGGTLGSVLIYLAVRMVGRERSIYLLKTHGSKIFLRHADLETVDEYFQKWGGYIIFLGRWLPALRTLVSIPAGISSMRWEKFTLLTFLGLLSWNSILCFLIFGFSAYIRYLEMGLEWYTWLTLALLVLFALYLFSRRISEKLGLRGAGGDHKRS